jgi:FkbM family methyltransferase
MSNKPPVYEEELVTNTYGRHYYIYKNDSFYQQRIAGAGPYQKQNLVALRRMCPNPKVILDVGMNIGMNSIEYATFADEVHGFEPTPQTYDMALRNIAMNEEAATKNWFLKEDPDANMIPTGKIVTHNIGLGDTNETLEIIIKKDNAGHNHVDNIHIPTKNGRQRIRRVEPPKVEITVKTLDSLNYPEVDIIKVDTEGYEFPVVLGAEETIMRCRPIVQLEMVEGQPERFGYTCQGILDWFAERDYDCLLADGTNVHGEWSWVQRKMERFFVPKELDLGNKESKALETFFEVSE